MGKNRRLLGRHLGSALWSCLLRYPGHRPSRGGRSAGGVVVGAFEGAVIIGGLTAVGAALAGIGIPKDSIIKYETQLKADKFILACHGTAEEMEKAHSILGAAGAVELNKHI